jgi:hypothetical protein
MSHQREVQKERKNFQSLPTGERSCDINVALLGRLVALWKFPSELPFFSYRK